MSNSRGQNPCVVSAYLQSACLPDPTQAFVYSLEPHFHYTPPSKAAATPCECSTVYYSTIQGCAACQDDGDIEFAAPWSTWSLNCSATSNSQYVGFPPLALMGVVLNLCAYRWPNRVPSGTAIPSWAFLDVVQADRFNVTVAENLAGENLPDTTMSASAQSTATVSTPLSASQSAQTSPPDTSGGTKKKTNGGAIAGAVIGTIALVGIIGTAIFFFLRARTMRRSRARGISSEQSMLTSGEKTPTNFSIGSPPPASMGWSSVSSMPPPVGWNSTPSRGFVPYDPENPATFPDAVRVPVGGGDARYTGAPEV